MDMMKKFDELTAEELFAFAQPEDYEKFGVTNLESEVEEYDIADSVYAMDFELLEQEAAEHAAYVAQHGVRAERRRRTRNKKAALKRIFCRIYGAFPGALENPNILNIIQKTSSKNLNEHHSEVNCWRAEWNRARDAVIRQENQRINKIYLGLVEVEEAV